MNVIVDTNIVSYIYKKDTRAELYKPHLANLILVISFMTLAELKRWTLENNWGEKRQQHFAEFLKDFLVINSDESLCDVWAKIMSDAKKKGKPIETADAWVASVAIMFDIPLVTHNRKHFENIENLKIISES